MKRDWQIENQIEAYLGGRMGLGEKMAFEKLLLEDNALNEKVKNEKLLKLNINRYHRSKIKKQLQEIHANTINRKSNLKIYILLGSVILLLLLAFYYFSKKDNYSNQELYAMYYEKYSIENDQRNISEDELDNIFNLYESGSFDNIVSQTEEYGLKNIPSSYRLILGISYLELNDLERAKLTFQSIIDEQDIIFQDQALWYKALAELRLNNTNAAKVILVKIAGDKSSDHYENAKKLIDSLD